MSGRLYSLISEPTERLTLKIIIPKTLCEIDPNYGPIFFLAGPVRGGDDWQKRCCEKILELTPHFYAAIPYYHSSEISFPLMKIAMEGTLNHFSRQLDWERHYLALAAKQSKQHGCIIFWLPEESKTNPRTDGAYATDTRGEIARWSVELKYNPTYNVVVGAEQGFPGLSQIHRNFIADQGSDFPFYPTLTETVKIAVSKAC